MGQTAAEIEHELERKRHALTARISRLEDRVRDDISTVRNRTTGHIEGMKQAAKDDADSALHTVGSKTGAVLGSNAGSESTVAQHPKSLMGSAAAGGFVLGLIGGGDDDERDRDERERRAYESRYGGSNGNGHANGHKSGLLGSTLGKTGVAQLLSETVRDVMHIQAGVLLDTALDTAKSVGKSAAGWDESDERSPAEKQDPRATHDWRDVEAPPATTRVPRAPVGTI